MALPLQQYRTGPGNSLFCPDEALVPMVPVPGPEPSHLARASQPTSSCASAPRSTKAGIYIGYMDLPLQEQQPRTEVLAGLVAMAAKGQLDPSQLQLRMPRQYGPPTLALYAPAQLAAELQPAMGAGTEWDQQLLAARKGQPVEVASCQEGPAMKALCAALAAAVQREHCISCKFVLHTPGGDLLLHQPAEILACAATSTTPLARYQSMAPGGAGGAASRCMGGTGSEQHWLRACFWLHRDTLSSSMAVMGGRKGLSGSSKANASRVRCTLLQLLAVENTLLVQHHGRCAVGSRLADTQLCGLAPAATAMPARLPACF